MAKEVMQREASDNQYLHKDFHISLNIGIEFIRENYGRKAVIDYLKKFSKKYYALITEVLKKEGLVALKNHIQKIYEIEHGDVEIEYSEDEMIVKTAYNPALKHFEENNVAPSPMYIHTITTVYETICEGTPFAFKLIEYDEKTGRSIQKFYRRDVK